MITKTGKLTAKKVVDALKNLTLGKLERARYPMEEQIGDLTYAERKQLEKKLLRPGTKLSRDRSVKEWDSYAAHVPGRSDCAVAGPGTSYVYAHELGHLSSPFGGAGPGSSSVLGGLHGLAYMVGSNGIPINFLASRLGGGAELVGRTAVLGGTAAMLAEEAQASLRAVKAIREVKGDKAAKDAAKKLSKGFASYVAAAAASNDLVPRLSHALHGRRSHGIMDLADVSLMS